MDKRALAALYSDSLLRRRVDLGARGVLGVSQDLPRQREATEERVRDLMVPPPELYTVANMSNLLHLGPLTERTASPRCCSKSSQALLAILSRVTNAGSRGWESTLLAAAQGLRGRRARVHRSRSPSRSRGMHPAAAPRRAPAVARALRAAARAAGADARRTSRTIVHKASGRRQGGDPAAPGRRVLLPDCATLDAHAPHAPAGGPARACRPLALPHASLSAAHAPHGGRGARTCSARASRRRWPIQRHLVSEPRSRKKPEARPGRHAKHEPEALSYSSSWLGGRSGPSVLAVRPAVQVVSGLLSASYRSIFIPFWLHGNHHGHRASRLDSAQFAALHNLSAAHRMCALLPTEDFQKASGSPSAARTRRC